MKELTKLMSVLDEMEDELFELEQFLHKDVPTAVSMWEAKAWAIRNFAEHDDNMTNEERMHLRLAADLIYRRAWERRNEKIDSGLSDVYMNMK